MNLQKLDHWDDDSLPSISGQQYNEVIGWAQPQKNKEYAILGSIDSLYIFDVTQNIQKLFVFPGASKNCIDRDFAIGDHYLYTIADQGKAALQIFDLQYLPDSCPLIYSNDSLSQNAHTIYFYEQHIYLAKNKRGNKTYPLDIINVSNPYQPTLFQTLVAPKDINGMSLFDFVHDIHIKNDTLFCFCGTSGMFIYHINNIQNIQYIYSLTQYPGSGYSHSGVFYNNYLFATDENNGKGIKIFNCSQIQSPVYINTLQSSVGAIPHIPYIFDNKLWLSAYQDGIYVWDLSTIDSPFLTAYYDTYPQNAVGDYAGLKGCWAVYPNLPSKKILVSDMTNGLIILRLNQGLSIANQTQPFKKPCQLYDINGKLLYHAVREEEFYQLPLCSGIYILHDIKNAASKKLYKY